MIYMSEFKVINRDEIGVDKFQNEDFIIDRVKEVVIKGDSNQPIVLNDVKNFEFDLDYKVSITKSRLSTLVYNYCKYCYSIDMIVKFYAVYFEDVTKLAEIEVEFRNLKLSNIISAFNMNSDMVIEFVDVEDGK